jgi:D-alanine-D-alanine ligase
MKILIITGGNSSERKISLTSARMVTGALRENGHSVTVFDFKNGYIVLKKLLAKVNFDIVFPVMHGKEGEDGILYHFLRSIKIPFVGSDPRGAKIAFDKILFKKYCDKNHIPTADWRVVKNMNDIARFGFPCVLKAANGGSSHEVALLHSSKDVRSPMVKKIFKLHDSFFVEKLINGVEITIGVLLGKALPVMEIIPPKDAWFDYKNKYSGKSKEIPFAPSISRSMQRRVQKIALQIHRALKLGSYSRTDVIVKGSIPFVLEINTPGGVGLTPESLLPKAAKAVGISFKRLVEEMLKGARFTRSPSEFKTVV